MRHTRESLKRSPVSYYNDAPLGYYDMPIERSFIEQDQLGVLHRVEVRKDPHSTHRVSKRTPMPQGCHQGQLTGDED